MTPYELLSIILSLIAICISLLSWRSNQRPRKRKAQSIATTTPVKPVSANQQWIRIEKDESKKRQISAELLHEQGNNYKLIISNNSRSDVKNVEMELIIENPKITPYYQQN